MGLQAIQDIDQDGQCALREAPDRFAYETELCFTGDGWAGVQIGMDGQGRGWALLANAARQELHLMESRTGLVFQDRGARRLPLKRGAWYPIRVRYDGKSLRLWFNENPKDLAPWPKFEVSLTLAGNLVGTDTGRESAVFRGERCSPLQPDPAGETFTNPILPGADPDILFYGGRYYLYNRVPNDPNFSEDAYLRDKGARGRMDQAGDAQTIFRAAWSEDLVHWSPYTPVLRRDRTLEGAFCMSPNVFYQDGYFYLLFAAGGIRGATDFHVYYAVSRSPLGPFQMRTASPLHSDCGEIGGMPFVDGDGQVYITYVRFDGGNHIFLQRLQARGGVLTPEDDTLVHILSPETDYEIDEWGRIVEGGVIIPHKGLYYMIYADGHYKGHYGESYAVSENIFGPYRRYAYNPILNHHFQADGAGDGIVIYNADRTQMYLGYHRHYSLEDIEPRMTCIDPMRFVPDPEGGPDILVVRGPSTAAQAMPFTDLPGAATGCAEKTMGNRE